MTVRELARKRIDKALSLIPEPRINEWRAEGGHYDNDTNPCESNHRYSYARRRSADGNIVCWIGLNPSKSDCENPARRRSLQNVIGQIERCLNVHVGGLIIVNLVSNRAT